MDPTTLLGIPAETLDGFRADMRNLVVELAGRGLTIDEVAGVLETAGNRQIRKTDRTSPYIAEVLLDFTRDLVRDAIQHYHDLADRNEL